MAGLADRLRVFRGAGAGDWDGRQVHIKIMGGGDSGPKFNVLEMENLYCGGSGSVEIAVAPAKQRRRYEGVRPWEAEGISRDAWYQRRHRARG